MLLGQLLGLTQFVHSHALRRAKFYALRHIEHGFPAAAAHMHIYGLVVLAVKYCIPCRCCKRLGAPPAPAWYGLWNLVAATRKLLRYAKYTCAVNLIRSPT